MAENTKRKYDKLTPEEEKFVNGFSSKSSGNRNSEYLNYYQELTRFFLKCGFNKSDSAVASLAVLSAMTTDYIVEGLTYKDVDFRLKNYMTNIYFMLFGEAGTGKSLLLNNMKSVFEDILGEDHIVSTQSSSKGLFKNLKKADRVVLLFGDDDDGFLDPKFKEGTVQELLLYSWDKTKMSRILQSHEESEKKNVRVNMWISTHELDNRLEKEQIEVGLMRRVFPLKYEKILPQDNGNEKQPRKVIRRNLDTPLDIKFISNIKKFIDNKIQPFTEKTPDYFQNNCIMRIDITEHSKEVEFLNEVADRIEDYIKKVPSYLHQTVRTYFEILQRASGIIALWDGSSVLKIDGKEENLNMIITEDILRNADNFMWPLFTEYYEDLAKIIFSGKKFEPDIYEESIKDVIDKAKIYGKTDGTNFVCPKSYIRRNTSKISTEDFESIIQTGIETGSFMLKVLKEQNAKKPGIYIVSKTENIVSFLKKSGFSSFNKKDTT